MLLLTLAGAVLLGAGLACLAAMFCDRVAVLVKGQIVIVGDIGEVVRSDHPWVRAYFQGRRASALRERMATAPA